jgi:hypothetical protein
VSTPCLIKETRDPEFGVEKLEVEFVVWNGLCLGGHTCESEMSTKAGKRTQTFGGLEVPGLLEMDGAVAREREGHLVASFGRRGFPGKASSFPVALEFFRGGDFVRAKTLI